MKAYPQEWINALKKGLVRVGLLSSAVVPCEEQCCLPLESAMFKAPLWKWRLWTSHL